MCKRNSSDKNEAIMGCVRETPQIKTHKNEASTGCVREPPCKKTKTVRDV